MNPLTTYHHGPRNAVQKIHKPNSIDEKIERMTWRNKLYELKMMKLAESESGNPRFVDMYILARNEIEFQDPFYF